MRKRNLRSLFILLLFSFIGSFPSIANTGADWQSEVDFSDLEKEDDLKALKDDLGADAEYFDQKEENKVLTNLDSSVDTTTETVTDTPVEAPVEKVAEIVNQEFISPEADPALKKVEIFDVGVEEKKLLDVAKTLEHKIKNTDWNEIQASNRVEKYEIQEGDYLWKISQKLFGSGFYYSKIWSMNPYITNPHEVKPGMVLIFNTGDEVSMPEISLSSFEEDGVLVESEDQAKLSGSSDGSKKEGFKFSEFGEDAEPTWLKEKQQLIDKGHYFQFGSEKTYSDLRKVGDAALVKEYEQYTPPVSNVTILPPADKYDETGFSKESKVNFTFKEGLSLTTYITSNLVQDLGEIDSSDRTDMFISKHDRIFVKFNPSVRVIPGSLFSVYTPMGLMTHPQSDRKGYRYTIVGEIKVIKKVSHLWECAVTDSTGIIQRKDRLTIHTPPIGKIITTFNTRMQEAIIVAGFSDMQESFSYGDVVYLDRGRADGVEMGNVFELYSFQDGLTERKITPDPTYKIGELTIISLTDNFATALITQSDSNIPLGTLAITKTKEKVALQAKLKNKKNIKHIEKLENKVLDNLDVELAMDDLNEDLLKKADEVQLSEDELAELEKQEREKSFIQRNDQDLKDLERLEKEIETVEGQLAEKNKDEDQLLEKQNLNELEKKISTDAKDVFDALNDIEKNEGKKYLDEDINSKENPYGLSKFDIEEVDALLNSTSEETNSKKQ